MQLEDQEFFENTENLYNSKNPKYEMIEDEFDCDKCDHGKLLQEYKKKLREKEIQLSLYYKELNSQKA